MNTTSSLLAIVVPYYKLTFFEETLKSLAHQTDKRFKLYIGDDASPENPLELLAKYKGDLEFLYHRFPTNLGGTSLVKQWERCIALTENETWLMLLGDDDTLGPNVVEKFHENVQAIQQLNISVIRYATYVINSKNEIISKLHQHPQMENAIDFLMRKFQGGTRSTLSEYIFKMQVVKDIRFKEIPLAWYSDLLAVMEFSSFGQLYTINEATVYFRLSSSNITGRTDDLHIKNTAAFDFYYYLLENKFDEFNKIQRREIYNRLEKTFLDNKKKTSFWVRFTKLYFIHGNFKRYLFFVFKAIRSILKNRIK